MIQIFFLYLYNPQEPFYSTITQFITVCTDKSYSLVTSTETIQEIIHYSINIKQRSLGLALSQLSLQVIDDLLPVDKDIIHTYLELSEKYSSMSSRDLLHAAVCVNLKLDIITCDKDLRKVKEISVYKPEEFITNFHK